MICDTILDAVGNTPHIRLHRMVKPGDAEVLVKFEGLEVGGSIKTRTALRMIERAEKEGLIDKDSIIVEPTSGNHGIGLALIGAVKGHKTVIIMPDSVSEERRKLVQHYGAEVVLTHDDGDIGKSIRDCIDIANDMKNKNPKVYIPQQFENPANLDAQYYWTAKEIIEETGKKIDGFVSGI